MLYQLEGSQAVAKAIALCRPKVVCAYPITPQTHIVEELGNIIRSGELDDCEYINVESEMAALSVSIGSQAAGVRSYTATSSQGLLYMMEAVYNASGLELPIVMTLGNRAIGSPINIWNDHTDAMSARDAGWIMLFAETNQEAVDLHIQAFKIAEKVKCPVMVCMDGFILTHAYERIDIPSQKDVDAFLPPYDPHISLDKDDPIAIGTMVPPEYFTEVRYMTDMRQLESLEVINCVSKKFQSQFGRNSGGLLHCYNTENAETIIITMGSIAGTVKDTIDQLNLNGGSFGVISIVSFRPFPHEELKNSIKNAKKIVVLEKAFAVGNGGILAKEIAILTAELNIHQLSLIAGLGGRSITSEALSEYLTTSQPSEVFLGLNEQLIKEKYESISSSCSR